MISLGAHLYHYLLQLLQVFCVKLFNLLKLTFHKLLFVLLCLHLQFLKLLGYLLLLSNAYFSQIRLETSHLTL